MKSDKRSGWQGLVRMSGSLALMALLVLLGMWSGTVWAGINVWTSIGPDGGPIQLLAIAPRNPSTIYAESSSGQVFQSRDGGGSWGATIPVPTNSRVGVLVVDPQNPSTVYAGSDGVFKSTDGGASWGAVNSGLPAFFLVGALAVDPQNQSTLYAGSYTTGGIGGGGVFKSTDGGASWSAANSGLLNYATGSYYAVDALAIDPLNTSTVYAATFGVAGGVFKSTDGGANWQAVNSGLPTSTDGSGSSVSVFALVIDPLNSNTLYAGTERGPLKSTDGGQAGIR